MYMTISILVMLILTDHIYHFKSIDVLIIEYLEDLNQ